MKNEEFETIAKFKSSIIPHTQYSSALDQIMQAYELNDQVGYQQNLICIGVSGTGKSTIKRMAYEEHPPSWIEGQKRIPILIIDTPSLPTVKNMAEAVLYHLGDPNFHRGSAVDKTGRIMKYIKSCGVKLIIFDELQHFIDQGNRTAPRQVSDWLKTLIDQSGASTVLMGLTKSEYILRINEQLRRRFSRRVDLRPFTIDDQQGFWEFMRVLIALDKILNLPESISLSEDMVHRFHFATNGIMGYMVNLMISAYQVAMRNNRSCVSQACLEEAFIESIWSSGKGVSNPFSSKFNYKPLTEVGMPFHAPLAKGVKK